MADPATHARVAGLHKAYGQHRALDRISFEVSAGQLVGVVGPNAAGKSTLLACLAGTATYVGVVERPARIAFLPQRAQLPASATAGEVLALFAALHGASGPASSWPDGFLPPLERPMGQLSGGQRQRLTLAAVLGGEPDLVLLDEPTANLDPNSREAFWSAIAAHCARGAAVLIASPVVLDVLASVDRVLALDAGRLVRDQPAAEYLAGLEMSVWVLAAPGRTRSELAALPGAVRAAQRGEWVVIESTEAASVGLLEALRALGVRSDEIRIGALGARAASPGHLPGEPAS